MYIDTHFCLLYRKFIFKNLHFFFSKSRFSSQLFVNIAIICGQRLKIRGLENISKDRGCILLLNHQCLLDLIVDCFILSSMPATVITKREMLMIPFFGWIPWLVDHIYINRSKPEEAKRIIFEEGQKAINVKNVSFSIINLFYRMLM